MLRNGKKKSFQFLRKVGIVLEREWDCFVFRNIQLGRFLLLGALPVMCPAQGCAQFL
jgi:hypothetical protein